jgi:hypothetical protein
MYLLVILCPNVSISGHAQQPQTEKDLVTKSSDHSEMKVWITLPDKAPRPAEVTAEEKENEWQKSKDKYWSQYWE